MCLSRFSDAFSIARKPGRQEHTRAGRIVGAGPGLFPLFEVIAVSDDEAWVRDVQTGADHLALPSRCRKKHP